MCQRVQEAEKALLEQLLSSAPVSAGVRLGRPRMGPVTPVQV